MRIIGCVVGVLFTASLEVAQPIRTFVSSVNGSDLNPCTKTAPCRSFNAAVAAVTSGGEVVALDTGGYGPVIVTKGVVLIAVPAAHVAIAATAGTAIQVSAGSADLVRLRNIYLNAQGGAFGIHFESGAALNLENVVVAGFLHHGLISEASGDITIHGSTFRHNNDTGIVIMATSGLVSAQIDGTLLLANGNPTGIGSCGGLTAGDNSRVTISNTIAASNFRGFQAFGPNAEITLERSSAVNGVVGLFATGSGAVIRASNSTIVNNSLFGIEAGSGTQILTRLNNTVAGNAAAETFTSTFTAQ